MSIVSNIVKPIVSSIVGPVVKVIDSGVVLRNIISFDGINQYGTLATPWAPGGQGRITLHVKASNLITEAFYLFDSDASGLNRLYCFRSASGSVYNLPAGISVSVDGGGTTPNIGEVSEIVITGDMTGLSLGTLAARYSNEFHLNGNILYAKFEDLSTTVAGTNDLEFDFSSGVSTEAPINEGASNLITYQNYSSDQWATYIQQPNGDWKGKANLVTNGGFDTDTDWTKGDGWAISGGQAIGTNIDSFTKTITQAVVFSLGEVYKVSYAGSADTGAFGIQDINGVVSEEAKISSAVNIVDFEFSADTNSMSFKRVTAVNNATLDNVSVNHLIKLSTAQQNQFYIDQTEAAIAGYKAKHTSGYVTTLDGIDDYVALDTPWTPTISGSFEVSALVNTTSEAEIVSSDTLSTDGIYMDITAGSVRAFAYVAGVIQGLIQTTATTFADGKTHFVKLVHPANGFAELWVDDVLEDTAGVAWALNGNQYVSVIGHRDTSTYTSGYIREVSCIDHESPLPIGQGGNSGFWPLDDADDIARNVLGLDGNGNVIARTGATLDGFGTWNGSPSRELFSLDVTTGSLVSDTTTLTLSTELQRLYDLSIVEAKIAKLDAQFARVQPLLNPDGIDDYGLFSAWTAAGIFTVETMFATSSAVDMGIVWSAADQYARLLAGDLRVLNTATSLDSGVNSADGTLHTFRLEYDGTNSSIYIDEAFVSTIAGLAIPNVISRLWYYQSGLFSGYGSYLKLIDYAEPTNSRFYMPTATGLVDLLGTGLTDGTYNGSPAAPELFYRVGDNWQNADASTIIPGA